MMAGEKHTEEQVVKAAEAIKQYRRDPINKDKSAKDAAASVVANPSLRAAALDRYNQMYPGEEKKIAEEKAEEESNKGGDHPQGIQGENSVHSTSDDVTPAENLPGGDSTQSKEAPPADDAGEKTDKSEKGSKEK
jgi:hypothetical protein